MIATIVSPTLFIGEVLGAIALLTIGASLILGKARVDATDARRRLRPFVEREAEFAASLGFTTKRWLVTRAGATVLGTAVGIYSGVHLLYAVGFLAGAFGVRWALEGRASSRRLRMERSFLSQLKSLGHLLQFQPLDTALRQIGSNPGDLLRYVLSPLADVDLSIDDRLLMVASRSHSAVVEQACMILLAARTRGQDGFRRALKEILEPVGAKQVEIRDDGLAALSQQRAVSYAMTALLTVMFGFAIQVKVFSVYYQTFRGQVTLLFIVGMFLCLIFSLGRIVRMKDLSRWDAAALRRTLEQLGG